MARGGTLEEVTPPTPRMTLIDMDHVLTNRCIIHYNMIRFGMWPHFGVGLIFLVQLQQGMATTYNSGQECAYSFSLLMERGDQPDWVTSQPSYPVVNNVVQRKQGLKGANLNAIYSS